MKKQIVFKLLISLIFVLPFFAFAESTATLPSNSSPRTTGGSAYIYTLLAPMPGLLGTTIDTRTGLGTYLNTLYTAGIAIATGLAVLMIIFGGIQYVSSDAIGGKSDGKGKIQDAILGLLLAFMSYIILNTLNPDLLKNDLTLENVQTSGVLKNDPLFKEGSLVNVPNQTPPPSSVPKNEPPKQTPFTEPPLPTGPVDPNRPNLLFPPLEDGPKKDIPYETTPFT